MDYSAYTVRELRKLAQDKWGADAAQLKTKAELIAALNGLTPVQARAATPLPPPRAATAAYTLPPLDEVNVAVSLPDGFRPSAPLPPPSPDVQWVEQRVVDHDFFVDAGPSKPRQASNRVFAFNQDPKVIAISWQVTEQTLNEGVSLFMVGDDGKDQSHVQALTTGEGFAVIDASVSGPVARAQLRHTRSGAVVATSSNVSLPARGVAASNGAQSVGRAMESTAVAAAQAISGSAAHIPTAASKRQASSW